MFVSLPPLRPCTLAQPSPTPSGPKWQCNPIVDRLSCIRELRQQIWIWSRQSRRGEGGAGVTIKAGQHSEITLWETVMSFFNDFKTVQESMKWNCAAQIRKSDMAVWYITNTIIYGAKVIDIGFKWNIFGFNIIHWMKLTLTKWTL